MLTHMGGSHNQRSHGAERLFKHVVVLEFKQFHVSTEIFSIFSLSFTSSSITSLIECDTSGRCCHKLKKKIVKACFIYFQ